MNQEQWNAIKNRDASFNQLFYCGLVKSKTVCRVSCAYWKRDIKNIAVFDTLDDALAMGYHPCSHCRPDKPVWAGSKNELVSAAKKYIETHYMDRFSLETLSNYLFINGSYLLRTFKASTGRTLLWYHNHVRCEKAKALLTHNEYSIAAVGDMTGFASSAHFSHVFKKMLGLTPSEYRNAYLLALDSDNERNSRVSPAAEDYSSNTGTGSESVMESGATSQS